MQLERIAIPRGAWTLEVAGAPRPTWRPGRFEPSDEENPALSNAERDLRRTAQAFERLTGVHPTWEPIGGRSYLVHIGGWTRGPVTGLPMVEMALTFYLAGYESAQGIGDELDAWLRKTLG
jgi:hypothetical protein